MRESQQLKKLPVGMQTFSEIIKGDYLYIDKTEDIYKLVKDPKGVYFLSRPRRFGKSLLVSTLEEVFLGNKELFKDLWIYKSDYEWKRYPVIKIDFSSLSYESVDQLRQSLDNEMDNIAKSYQVILESKVYKDKFRELILKLKEKNQVVILIDEYDKPLINYLGKDTQLVGELRNILREFYTIIKTSDQYIRFVLLTGVSKFSKMSLFSGLNNLRDLTMSDSFSTLLGITQKELKSYFDPYIKKLTQKYSVDEKELVEHIRVWYNGYRFSSEEKTVYNPFSTLLLFEEQKFQNYWFETATPSFLIDLLKGGNYNLSDIVGKDYFSEVFSSYDIERVDAVPLFFQTGYLTITNYQRKGLDEHIYTLDFPNQEVKSAFNKHLLEDYLYINSGQGGTYILSLRNALQDNNMDKVFEVLQSFFSNIPYDLHIKQERYYQTVFFSIFLLLGYYIDTECKTNKGRIDAVIKVGAYGNKSTQKIYIFEFKLDDTAENAIKQIREREYYKKYTSPPSPLLGKERGGRAEGVVGEVKGTLASQKDYSLPTTNYQLFLIGVNFSTKEKNIKNWLVEKF